MPPIARPRGSWLGSREGPAAAAARFPPGLCSARSAPPRRRGKRASSCSMAPRCLDACRGRRRSAATAAGRASEELVRAPGARRSARAERASAGVPQHDWGRRTGRSGVRRGRARAALRRVHPAHLRCRVESGRSASLCHPDRERAPRSPFRARGATLRSDVALKGLERGAHEGHGDGQVADDERRGDAHHAIASPLEHRVPLRIQSGATMATPASADLTSAQRLALSCVYPKERSD